MLTSSTILQNSHLVLAEFTHLILRRLNNWENNVLNKNQIHIRKSTEKEQVYGF